MKTLFYFLTNIPGLVLLAALTLLADIKPAWLVSLDQQSRAFLALQMRQPNALQDGFGIERVGPGHGTDASTDVPPAQDTVVPVSDYMNHLYKSRMPQWWGEKLSLTAVAIILLGLLPLFRALTASVLVGSLTVAAIAVQMYAVAAASLWLSLVPAVVLLMGSAPFVIAWNCRRSANRQVARQLTQTRIELADYLQKQGELERAFAGLKLCPPIPPVLTLCCDIAGQYRAMRKISEAVDIYRHVLLLAPGFAAAVDGQKAISAMRPGVHHGTVRLAATQQLASLPDAVENSVIGRYRITREIGRGAMGVVYLGEDPRIDRAVAIKTLNFAQLAHADIKPLKERFFREAAAAGRLNHPNIVTVYDAGEEHDLAYIAMDYIDGRPLSDFIQPKKLLPVETVCQLITLVADAVHYAHQQKIVHRDIKPANILYNAANGTLKVSDFGVARICDDTHTQTGDILGSPIYMAPELFQGSKATPASDIFSLGVTFYQLLTGAVPYSGDSIAQLAYQVVSGKHHSPRDIRPELPVAVVRIINRSLQKDPGKRFADAAEMAGAIRKNLLKKNQRVA